MRRDRPAAARRRTVLASALTGAVALAVLASACAGGAEGAAVGADVDRPAEPSMALVRLDDVAAEVGLEFRHGAFRTDTSADPNAMMGAGVCWIDADGDGWLDLFVVNSWSEDEWGRWRREGSVPTTRLFRNDRGRFVDVTDDFDAGLEVRGSGCVAGDLDLDGHTDLYVTSERENVLLWNDGGERFETDDGTSGTSAYGWHAGAAIGDVDGDGWPDLFVAGYADLNRPVPEATRGFPNTFVAEPDLLYLNQGADDGTRPVFVEVATEVGIEPDRVDYGLGALFSDVDRDGDLDLYVANDTQPNRLYVNEPSDADPGFELVDRAGPANADDDEAGMGVAVGDYDGDGLPDLAVTNLAGQGHAVHRGSSVDPLAYEDALDPMGLPDLGQGETGWGVTWTDLDLDGDLDLVVAHGHIPVTDLDADREPLQVFENLTDTGATGRFVEVTTSVLPTGSRRYLARGLAAADYDNDGDPDLAVATIGGDLALLRTSGGGGHWLVVAPEPATPGTLVTVTTAADTTYERELVAGSSYLSTEDPRALLGIGTDDGPVDVVVLWPDGTTVTRRDVPVDQIVVVEPAS